MSRRNKSLDYKLDEKNFSQMRNDLDLSDLKPFFFRTELYVLYVPQYGLFELTTPFTERVI